jgi:hypothetical protein
MSAEPKHLNPSDFSDDQLDRLAFALVGKLQKYFVVDRPMRAKEAAEFCGISEKHLYHLVNLGVIKDFRPDPKGHAFFIPSQMIEAIKNHKQK